MEQKHATPEQHDYQLGGYLQLLDEIQKWIDLREGSLKEAWDKFGFLVIGLAAQAGTAILPFVTILGYVLPWYIDVLIQRWNRYNTKVGEKAKIREDMEREISIDGVESRAARAPSTGLDRQAKAEFGKINLATIVFATIAWAIRFTNYPWWINILCGVALVIVCIKSWRSIRSLRHVRVRPSP